ncbi:MAG: acetylornithine deacetylase [Alphaproteobacteria bacterium]|nr:MAG: acetylornithine deacetylase [Alphaproteobacteria bacterium]
MGAPAALADPTEVARRLERYVSIDSTNPDFAGGAGELAMGEALAADLTAMGLKVERQEIAPGRNNVFGRLGNDPSLPTIVLDSHLDTVPPSRSMAAPGWRDGVLYGRGACDDKGPLVAMVEAVRQIAKRPGPLSANVILLGTVDEEVTVKGAEAALGLLGDADLILIGEPTGLNIGTWHKGTTRFTLETLGRAGHSSMPEKANNAIMHMGEVLRRIDTDVIPALDSLRHEGGEGCKASVGAINGGGPLNQVPDLCRIGVDVRRIPGVETDEVLGLFDAAFRDMIAAGIVRRGPTLVSSRAFATTADAALTALLVEIAREHGAPSRPIGLPFGTNANRFAPGGAPSFIVGPGNIDHAHADDEQVALADVVAAANFYIDVVARAPALLGRSRANGV